MMGNFFGLDDKEIRQAYIEEAFVADVQFEISKLMKRKGVSRAELARRLNVSAPHVTQMLGNEDANLTLRTVARIFAALEDSARISAESSRAVEVKSVPFSEKSGGLKWSGVACANDAWLAEDIEPKSGTSSLNVDSSVVWLNVIRKVA